MTNAARRGRGRGGGGKRDDDARRLCVCVCARAFQEATHADRGRANFDRINRVISALRRSIFSTVTSRKLFHRRTAAEKRSRKRTRNPGSTPSIASAHSRREQFRIIPRPFFFPPQTSKRSSIFPISSEFLLSGEPKSSTPRIVSSDLQFF